MGTLSDLLAIPHFTTSRGSTVRRDFLTAVGEALGLSTVTLTNLATKDDVLAAVIEAATQQPMNTALFSIGGTVTNEALQAIIDGITAHGVPGRPPLPSHPEVVDDIDDLYAELDFDPEDLKDERDRKLLEIAVREGQDRFRTALMEAYDGRCAVTGYSAAETLQAAHIFPYRGPATNRVSNGLLLRADIHGLFDRGALAIHETNYHILLKPHLAMTQYASLADAGQTLRLPRLRANRPSVSALRSHREWAGM